MKRLCIIIAFILTIHIGVSAQSDYIFQQIGQDMGMTPYVQCISMDRQRVVVWAGTGAGVCRYNGYGVRSYRIGLVGSLLVDNSNGVWAITDKGLYRYDDASDDFLQAKDTDGNPVVATAMTLVEGGVVFGGRTTFYRYSYDSGEISTTGFVSGQRSNIASLVQWDGDVFLCTNRWNVPTLVNAVSGEVSPAPIKDARIRDISIDTKGNVWVTPYNKGIRCYSKDGTLIQSFDTSNSSLTTNIILCINHIGEHIAVGTDGEGIFLIDPSSGKAENLRHESGNPYSLPANSILCLEEDSKGNIWAGSVRNGLIRIKKAFLKFYGEIPEGLSYGLSSKTVNSLHRDPDGTLWIGTDGGGINSLDPSSGEFRHIPSTKGLKISSMTEAGGGRLLVSVFGKGVYFFDKATGALQRITVVDEKTDRELTQGGRSIYLSRDKDSDDIIFLCSRPCRFSPGSGTFTPLSLHTDLTGNLLPLSNDSQCEYFYDSRNIYYLVNDSFTAVYSAHPDSLIRAAEIDGNGTIWTGDDWGLTRVDVRNSSSQRISQKLISYVNAIVYDRKGSLVIGTDHQMFAYGINTGKIRLFGEDDGLPGTVYREQACISGDDGEIFMGTISGLLQLDGIPPEKTQSDVDVELFEVLISGERTQVKDGRLKIRESDLPLEIYTVARGKDIFAKPLYRFRIEGTRTSTEYIERPPYRIITMPPGRYTIKASCSDRDTEWTRENTILSLIVKAPIYRRSWFIILCLLFAAGIVYGLIYRKMTRQKHSLDMTLKEQEIRSEEEKVHFLININHELRTPLTLIHTPLKQILSTLPPHDRNYALLQNVTRQSEKMKKLLDMVLDVRKMEVAQSTLTREDVPLEQWLGDMISDFIPEASSRGISIVTQTKGAPETVCMDRSKCSSIIGNLLSNALKYSPDHSTIVVDAILREGFTRISVSDQGRGLAGVDMEHLFDRFYQGSASKPGTGIGLAYSKVLVEQQGGHIGAFQNEGVNGSTFWFELPVDVSPGVVQLSPNTQVSDLYKAFEETPVKEGDIFSKDLSSLSILIVEDNEELTDYLVGACRERFREVYGALDGARALSICLEKSPDIVVSDVQMPVMDGFELCRSIKGNIQISHIPVILLTARVDEQSRSGGYKSGADAYVTKPFDMDELLSIVQSQVFNRQKMRERFSHESDTLPSASESTFSVADETFLGKLNSLVDEHLSQESLDVEALYTMMAMGRSSFYSKLKILTGMSPNDYVTHRRIDRAADLLRTSDMRINEISDACGFSTQRYFSTVFKQYKGCTPSQWRSSGGKEEN